jgi:hypothetical protein
LPNLGRARSLSLGSSSVREGQLLPGSRRPAGTEVHPSLSRADNEQQVSAAADIRPWKVTDRSQSEAAVRAGTSNSLMADLVEPTSAH